MLTPKNAIVAVIGLGYVGLPLAVEFGHKISTVGFDIDPARIRELQQKIDRTLETTSKELESAKYLSFTNDVEAIRGCNTYIVTVPTPVDAHKRPDLTPLRKASETVGKLLTPGDVVIYESTVYPGATEDDCVPILEALSGLTLNKDFFVGYSPERINPGDKEHRLTSIRKVTAGSSAEAAAFVDRLYKTIIKAGTHLAPSIRVAEAAKVIENTQRDLNIALVNELALIFDRLGIDTLDVLEAAGTKWNFLPFRPGLVGGHCIGVDPYYLTHKAQEVGYYPEMLLAGRRINDRMGVYAASKLVREMIRQDIKIKGSRVLIMGLTFKENCPDLRNTRVVDIIAELRDHGIKVDVHDPWADAAQAQKEYGLNLVENPQSRRYDGLILAVAHTAFHVMGAEIIKKFGMTALSPILDIKGILPKGEGIFRL